MTESGQAILAQAGAVRSPHAQHMGADHVEFSGKEANPHGHARFVSALPPGSPISCDKSEAANGYRVAELFEQRSLVRSATVRVRGVVTKVTTGILGQTYFHLRDGSGTLVNRDNDLTAVTSQTVELGQVLEVEGKVVLNRDLGFGYRYDLLLESVVVLSKV